MIVTKNARIVSGLILNVSKILSNNFFDRDTTTVAQDLLGKKLCRLVGGSIEKFEINEVEAYLGIDDQACHSRNGKRTPRTEVMYGSAGTIYIYFTYGIHWMLNIVTEAMDIPTAVLIRGAGEFDGPAKLTKALQIDKELNNRMLGRDVGLWIEDAPNISYDQIIATSRIGINSTPEPWRSASLRFMIR